MPSQMWVDDRAGSRDLMAYEPVKSTGSLCTLDGADVMLIGNGPNNTDLTVGVEVKSVPYGYLHAFLFDLTAVGVRVAHVYNIEEAAAWLGVLHRWWTKPWDKHKGLKALDRSREVSLMPNMTAEEELMTRVASQLPGIGFDRAQAAARHFTNVVQLICAPTQEWEKVEGVGKVIAKAVVDVVRREK